ncbi:MAG: secondary thiamine-phosphate synthase enzyme YjbQ [Sphingomonadales bacterium]|nr:secondary thiamine-phosphate synthase enzyme YjbQ [Sphingomonadales bacterium]MDE2168695.1 secondary thiamine-phosphate synthase enzyme YjbQ [Sphingomonadales bacterium]
MMQATTRFDIATHGPSLTEFTREVARWLERQGIETGLLTLFCRHTSASLLIQENASDAVQQDLLAYFARIAPEGRGLYAHDDEGPDDMPAHLRTALTQVSLSIPVVDGRMVLGTWQGIYLFEHRRGGQRRQVVAHLIGD